MAALGGAFHWESRETAERRAVIHVCTVGGHPVQPQPGLLQHPAPPSHPSARAPGGAHLPGRRDTGAVPGPACSPQLCHSRLDQLLLFTARGLDATMPGRCWALPLPLQILWLCSPGGAWPWCCILLQSTCNCTQTDCKARGTARHPPGCLQPASGCTAPPLLLPPGKTRAGPGLSKHFEIQRYLKT